MRCCETSATLVIPSAAVANHSLQRKDGYANIPNVSRETLNQLDSYCALVQKWSKSINLVSRVDRDMVWSRHILDSLRLFPLIRQDVTHGIDLGSGAGFPGLVLALACNIPFDLIESDRRKAAFLLEAQRITNAPVRVHCARIEELNLPPAPLVTARALAPLTTLLAYTQRFLLPGGVALFLKGTHAAHEIMEAERHWRMQVDRFDDAAHPGSTILAVSGLMHA